MIIACVETPVPIPNTIVKRTDADGTKSQGLGEYVVARPYKPAFAVFRFILMDNPVVISVLESLS